MKTSPIIFFFEQKLILFVTYIYQ